MTIRPAVVQTRSSAEHSSSGDVRNGVFEHILVHFHIEHTFSDTKDTITDLLDLPHISGAESYGADAYPPVLRM